MAQVEKTAQEILDLLTKQSIFNSTGSITLNLMDVAVPLQDKSAIGYLLQEWFAGWLTKNNIFYRTNHNTQEFPDFFLDKDSNEKNLLELKTFDYDASPNFDVANFEAYCRSLKTKPYRLDANYLIFGYTFEKGVLIIKNIWLKNIWEITCSSDRFPIRTQVKQDAIYNIRPAIWYSKKIKCPVFVSKKDFILALFETLLKYKKTKPDAKAWLEEVKNSYKNFYGEELI